MDVQHAIRQNALEQQAFFRDLFDWEKDIAKKDKQISNKSRAATDAGSAQAGVRGRKDGAISAPTASLQAPTGYVGMHGPAGAAQGPAAVAPAGARRRVRRKKAKRRSGAEKGGAAPAHAATHTYDHFRSKWDKFDVDAALREASSGSESEYEWVTEEEDAAETGGQESTGSLETKTASAPMTEVSSTRVGGAAEALPPVRQASKEPETAEEWRVRGNDLFRAGQWADAVTCYTRSADVEPSAAALANRAMAYLKLQKFEEADADCAAALALPAAPALLVKIHQRQGTARCNLQRHLDAASSFEEAFRLQPETAALKKERDAALRAAMQAEKLRPSGKRHAVAVTVDTGKEVRAEAEARRRGAAAAELLAGGEERKAAAAARPPRSGAEVEARWLASAGDAAARLELLLSMDPAGLPGVFKSSLTPAMLSGFLEVAVPAGRAAAEGSAAAEGGVDAGRVLAFLEGLTRVQRFDMGAMCIPKAAKGPLAADLAAWAAAAGSTEQRVRGVAEKLRLA